MARTGIALVFTTAAMFTLGACSSEDALEQFQLCLSDKEGLESLKSELQQIAKSHEMEFSDQSATVLNDLRNVGYDRAEPPIIYMNAQDRDYDLTASNVGLGGYQVAIWLFGPISSEARAFAASTRQRLAKKWELHDIPLGDGARPLVGCTG